MKTVHLHVHTIHAHHDVSAWCLKKHHITGAVSLRLTRTDEVLYKPTVADQAAALLVIAGQRKKDKLFVSAVPGLPYTSAE